MTFKSLVPMLYTEQIEETIAFYTTHLGFTCGEKNDDWNWASIHRDEVEFMLAKPNAHISFTKPQFTGSFYIKVDDVDALWHQLKDKVTLCYPIENFEWNMREFAIYDNNGYVIQIGEELS
ncbi:bleomycin resistance family protein [Flavobacteriaceae bacterium 144Ye]|nr:bleomycin resistance family protein [Flavobacteriaceae bacterium 144Ye]